MQALRGLIRASNVEQLNSLAPKYKEIESLLKDIAEFKEKTAETQRHLSELEKQVCDIKLVK